MSDSLRASHAAVPRPRTASTAGPADAVLSRQGSLAIDDDHGLGSRRAIEVLLSPPDASLSHSLSPAWRRSIRRRLLLSDVVAVLLVTFGVQVLWVGASWGHQVDEGSRSLIDGPTYTLLSVLIALGWLLSLGLSGTRSTRVLGEGGEEYRRVLTASLWVFGLLAVFAYSMQYDVARGYVAISFPVGVAVLCAERALWRRWLNRQRALGSMVSRVLVLGTEASAATLAQHVLGARTSGLEVVGTLCTEDAGGRLEPETIVAKAAFVQANAVVVTETAHMEPSRLRALRWSLEERGAELIVAPALTGLAGQRVHTRPIEGLSLLHVEGARYDGSMRVVKGIFDRLFAAAALLALSPILVVAGVAVRLTSPGPMFYRSDRIGSDGRIFRMWKFRTMVVGADAMLAGLLETQGSDETPLFKLRSDPRITWLGAFLRKWSIDELPQLVNVLTGDMSVVGPRPQMPEEVALYDDTSVRRLRAKPGLTGLWQVSGRSDLTWERSLELDLYYVENWSFSFDLLLILRTFAVVARGEGAY